MTAHICTHRDIEWLMKAARMFFGDKVKDYASSQAWVEMAISNPNVRIIRTEDSALVAACSPVFFDPKSPKVNIQFFGGRRSEVEQLFHDVKDWSRNKGANEVYFQPKTGYNAAPLAEALGAEQDHPSYVWRF